MRTHEESCNYIAQYQRLLQTLEDECDDARYHQDQGEVFYECW